jgi:hypothetical protein
VIAGALLLLLTPAVDDARFEPWFAERAVAVSIARGTDGPPWIRGVAELPVAANDVFAIVVDYARYRELFSPAVAKAEVLERTEDGARIHFVWPYPFPFRRRDAVVAYRAENLPDGSFLVSWRDASRAGDPREGVRIARVEGDTRIVPLAPARCRVTYTYLGDLGGRFPGSLEEEAWRKEPLGYMFALRRRLGLPPPPK